MKKSVKVFIALAVLIFIFSFTPTKSQHVGTWKCIMNDKIGYFTFDNDGFAIMEVDDRVVGGKAFEEKGFQLTYTIDYKSKPIKLDFIVTKIETMEEKGRIKGIMEFISADKVKIALNTKSDERPTKITKENSDIFDKVKQ